MALDFSIRSLPAICLLLLSQSAIAQSGWRDMQGNALPETDTIKSKNDFSVSLIVTPDKDWREKWNTPPETIPHFSESREASDGGELYILTFLSNPATNAVGETDVSCDMSVARPDGSKSVDEKDIPCFKVKLTSDPHNVYLSSASLKYVAEPADPRGTWNVDVVMKDRVRGVQIPLHTSFTVR